MGKLIKHRANVLIIKDVDFFKIHDPIVLGVYLYAMYFCENNKPADIDMIAKHYAVEKNMVLAALDVLHHLKFLVVDGF